MDLVARAATALTHARRTDPDYGTHPVPVTTMLYRGRLAVDLGALLAVDPTLVAVTADPDRAQLGLYAQLLTVTDTTTGGAVTYRFTPVVGYEAGPLFHLLGPCPDCHAETPVATISTLADLGYYLSTRRAPHHTDEHTWDPNHRPDCPRATE